MTRAPLHLPLDEDAPDRRPGVPGATRATAQPLVIRRVETADGRLVPVIVRRPRRRTTRRKAAAP